jgi:DNA-binding HxlR family transcriptional regulator
MREKFEELYRRIQKISRCMNTDELKVTMERNMMVSVDQVNSLKKIRNCKKSAMRQQLNKLRAKGRGSRNKTKERQGGGISLEVSTSS